MVWAVPDPVACTLAAGAAPLGCDWCGNTLTGRQRRWCSPLCSRAWSKNHYWADAKKAAKARDRGRCVRCGRQYGLEVNHIHPLAAIISDRDERYGPGCHHHLSGLETLCHDCHVKATNKQRADGLFKRNPDAQLPRSTRTPAGKGHRVNAPGRRRGVVLVPGSRRRRR